MIMAIAPRTTPSRTDVFTPALPKLKVVIKRDGQPSGEPVDIPDPREAFCREFNLMQKEIGSDETAKPARGRPWGEVCSSCSPSWGGRAATPRRQQVSD